MVSFHRTSHNPSSTYANEVLKHPSGLAIFNGTLFVADQGINSVFMFDIETEVYQGVIAKLGKELEKDTIEGLYISSC